MCVHIRLDNDYNEVGEEQLLLLLGFHLWQIYSINMLNAIFWASRFLLVSFALLWFFYFLVFLFFMFEGAPSRAVCL